MEDSPPPSVVPLDELEDDEDVLDLDVREVPVELVSVDEDSFDGSDGSDRGPDGRPRGAGLPWREILGLGYRYRPALC